MTSSPSHRELNIELGRIHICSAFSADGHCFKQHCTALHICRAWLAGNCLQTACPRPHSLFDSHNSSVLSDAGLADLPVCEDNLRSQVALLFPQLCVLYARGECENSECTRLHMCKSLLLNGQCSLRNCKQSHKFGRRERSLLKLYSVYMNSKKSLVNPADVICADGEYVSECRCIGSSVAPESTPSVARAASAAATLTTRSSLEKNSKSAPSTDKCAMIDAEASENPTPSANDPYGAGLGAVHRASAEAALSLSRRTRVPRVPTSFCGITCANDVVLYLLRRGGWCSWHEFVAYFQIGPNYSELMQWLSFRQEEDISYCSQNLNWIRIRTVKYKATRKIVEELSIFRFTRLCTDHQIGNCNRGSTCKFLHICRDFLIDNICPNGANCPLGHSFEDTFFGLLPVPVDWTLEDQVRFVRECHPCICPAYNSASGCARGAHCLRLHVCNEWFVDRRCDGSCERSHDLMSDECRGIFDHHMISYSNLRYKLFVMPLPTTGGSRANHLAAASILPATLVPVSGEYETSPGPEKDGISSCDDVIRFLIAREGSSSWAEFCSHFGLSAATSYPQLEDHLNKVGKRDSSFAGQHPDFFHGLAYTTGHSHRFPDVLHMFRFVRVCATWNEKRRCRANCVHLHVCRDWLVGECAIGRDCLFGHSFASTPVAKLPFPPDWKEDDLRRFVRECHPSVCADYNTSAGCLNYKRCTRLHVCNEHLLLRCSSSYCHRNHNINSYDSISVYKRYGLQDLELITNLFRWLLMPVCNRLSDKPLESFSTVPDPISLEQLSSLRSLSRLSTSSNSASATVGTSVLTANTSESRNGSSADLKCFYHIAAAFPKSVNTSMSGDKLLPQTISNDYYMNQSNAVSQSHRRVEITCQKLCGEVTSHTTQSESTARVTGANVKRESFLCEKHLRGVCDRSDVCDSFHVEIPFDPTLISDVEATALHVPDGSKSLPVNYYWQFRVPPEWSSQPGLEYILNLEAESVTGDMWLSFQRTEEEALEKAFVDASNDLFTCQIDLSSRYPFASRTEIRFDSLNRSDSVFSMRTRLKQVTETSATLKPTGSTSATAYQLTKPLELPVRSLRTRSRCALSFKCTRATHWIWWVFDAAHQLDTQSQSEWIDASKIFGDHLLEVESAFLEGKSAYRFKTKLPQEDASPSVCFKFIFETMTLMNENRGNVFELRRRPAYLPFVSLHSSI